uniref:Uncharacterized protein n=1 Tax=Meloidogyne enterolobii TaxID=390850 RepID=A0A6V7UH56_MELEN|nr:unnamed protein product [Meloidogyne enterolobii]
MINISGNANGINIASQQINEQFHQRPHQQNNNPQQQRVLESVPQIDDGAHASSIQGVSTLEDVV